MFVFKFSVCFIIFLLCETKIKRMSILLKPAFNMSTSSDFRYLIFVFQFSVYCIIFLLCETKIKWMRILLKPAFNSLRPSDVYMRQ